MKWLSRKLRAPLPDIVKDVKVDPLESTMDLARAMNTRRDAETQGAHAHEVVNRLAESRIRNGFAPVIEQTIIRRYLGSAS